MKKYRASIAVEWDSTFLEQENAERQAEGIAPLTEDDIRVEMGNNLFEIIEDMVLNRQPFDFSFTVEE